MDRGEGSAWKKKCMAMRFSKIIFVAVHVDKEPHHKCLGIVLKTSGNIYICPHNKIAINNKRKRSGDSVVIFIHMQHVHTRMQILLTVRDAFNLVLLF